MMILQIICSLLGAMSSTIVIIAFWEKAWTELKTMMPFRKGRTKI